MGMTYELYWNGDPDLVKYYRRAEEIRNQRRNEELWLQGMYIYEALCDVSPIMHGFAKKGTKPRPYTSAPYPLTSKEIEREKREKEKQVRDKGLKMMEAFMTRTNKKFGNTETK